MRYGIISDIHGNLEALHAVLDHLHGENIDRCVCLGDLVGYGANPNECVALIRDVADHVVAGNHDWAAVGRTDISAFNAYARRAVLWTSDVLDASGRTYIEELPLLYVEDDLLFVHSTPDAPERWRYILSSYDALGILRTIEQRVCCIGHSHYPVAFLWTERDGVRPSLPSLTIPREARAIVNVGSVGQPRDGDPRACYGVLDMDGWTLEVKRIRYDIRAAQEKIRRAGLPEYLAERILQGA